MPPYVLMSSSIPLGLRRVMRLMYREIRDKWESRDERLSLKAEMIHELMFVGFRM